MIVHGQNRNNTASNNFSRLLQSLNGTKKEYIVFFFTIFWMVLALCKQEASTVGTVAVMVTRKSRYPLS